MDFSIDEIIQLDPYSLDREQKRALFTRALSDLTRHHAQNCPQYRRLLQAMEYDPTAERAPEEQPMVPVRLFKLFELCSVDRANVVKTMTSSGTSGQAVSKVFLDRRNVRDQTRTLAQIIGSFIGKKRLPLLILDTEQVKRDRSMFSARGAGIVGFSVFGRDIQYALDGDMKLDTQAVGAFLEKHRGERILMFGYTYMIWQYVVMALRDQGLRFFIDDGVLFHIGGWKKLQDQAVDTASYNRMVREGLGNVSVYNYYGMAEQLGSVFVECEYGHMHCSNYSDVIIRRLPDLAAAEQGQTGAIELLSLLPTSYPGHVLLTEDEGVVLGEDDCPCGRKGKYFKILGRIKGAEIRGCSDTYEQR